MAASMTWGGKASLIAYIGGLDDGEIEMVAPAERRGDRFWFPARKADALEFDGAVRLRGHWGMLDIEIGYPEVSIIDATHATLSIRERGRETTLAIADLTRDEITDAAPGVGTWTATLTGHGSQLLGGQYAPGTPLDPVVIE